MIRKFLIHTAMVGALGLTTGLAMASGSEGGGGAETGDTQAYNTGKGVYAQKLACGTCPLSGKSLDAMLARDLLAGKNLPTLTESESHALTVYLTRRFKL